MLACFFYVLTQHVYTCIRHLSICQHSHGDMQERRKNGKSKNLDISCTVGSTPAKRKHCLRFLKREVLEPLTKPCYCLNSRRGTCVHKGSPYTGEVTRLIQMAPKWVTLQKG